MIFQNPRCGLAFKPQIKLMESCISPNTPVAPKISAAILAPEANAFPFAIVAFLISSWICKAASSPTNDLISP
jgi:hypothetical protein